METKKSKIIFEQTLMISTGIFFMIGVGGVITHFTGGEFGLEWYHPISIILISFLCSFPTLLLKESEGGRSSALRILLHFLSLLAIVSLAGLIFKWYSGFMSYLSLAMTFVIVYVFVWIGSMWMGKVDENKINKALENFHDED